MYVCIELCIYDKRIYGCGSLNISFFIIIFLLEKEVFMYIHKSTCMHTCTLIFVFRTSNQQVNFYFHVCINNQNTY